MLEQFTDIELLRELIKRNGRTEAPTKVKRGEPFMSALIALGKDNTAEIAFPADCADEFGL